MDLTEISGNDEKMAESASEPLAPGKVELALRHAMNELAYTAIRMSSSRHILCSSSRDVHFPKMKSAAMNHAVHGRMENWSRKWSNHKLTHTRADIPQRVGPSRPGWKAFS